MTTIPCGAAHVQLPILRVEIRMTAGSSFGSRGGLADGFHLLPTADFRMGVRLVPRTGAGFLVDERRATLLAHVAVTGISRHGNLLVEIPA
jgi:hypothetical protein